MRLLTRLPGWSHVLLVAALLAGCWAVVYAAGGTRTAFPHVFYIPIVLAALPFGVPGGIAAGVAATVLCGPAMPLDVATGETQQLINWLVRGGFFVTVGGVAGGSTVSLRRSFQSGLAQQLQAELELVTDTPAEPADPGWGPRIRDMLDRRAFRAVFQPIYALDDGRLIAVEALSRFDTDPQHPPDVWFAQAAAVGLGVDLELAAVEKALDASIDLPDGVALTFNASPETLADVRLIELLDRHRQRPLIAEVTEHVIVDDYTRLDTALAALRVRGVRLAVDDAGAGFASLRHIVRLKPEFIKLDLSLTQNLRRDPVRQALAQLLLQFAAQIGSDIIVEGIETPADLATWRNLGAHAAQGYLLGRPGPLPLAPSNDRLRPGRIHASPALARSGTRRH